MKAWTKPLLFVLLGVVLLAPCFWGGYKIGLFNVAAIDILPMDGESSVAFELVKEKLQKKFGGYKDRPIWNYQISEITKLAKEEKWVKDLRMSRVIPNRVKLWVETQRVAALIAGPENKIFSVGIDGAILNQLGESKMPNAPFLTGKNFYQKSELRQKAVRLLEKLPEEGFFSRAAISELLYKRGQGFVSVLNQGGYTVLLGQKLGEEKVAELNQVLKYIQMKSLNARVIDARLSKKVLVTKRKQP